MACLAFVGLELWQLGWLTARSGVPRTTPIREISGEALELGHRPAMMNAWVHQIDVGEVVAFHDHPTRAELVAVLRGRARVRGLRRDPAGDAVLLRKEIVGPGHLVLSPPASVHEFANVGDGPLWTLVVMSPPVRGNRYLEPGQAPASSRDFVVIPWADGGAARGAGLPDWFRAGVDPWRGEIGFFPGIAAALRSDPAGLRGDADVGETWLLLLAGEGVLAAGGAQAPVRAPAWLELPRGSWTLEGKGGELVALEIGLPRFDARLFQRSLAERHGLAFLEPRSAGEAGAD